MTKAGIENSNNISFQLWQQDNHPIALITEKMLLQKLDYMHNNPVKAGFVDDAKAWLYSSARDDEGGEGLLKSLTKLDIGIRN